MRNLALIGGLGYGLVPDNSEPTYVSGSDSRFIRDFVEFSSAEGIEISGTFIAKF